ncbi:MAG: hypothetical protein ACTSQE_12635 [Candidatus Heimdallarchaeaceae archaeon]
MKTLFEKYKEDLKPVKIDLRTVNKEYKFMFEGALLQIKQSYLNSIDCQIDWLMKKGQIHSARNFEYPDPAEEIYSDAMIEVLNHLKEQRKLITDYLQ